MTEQWALFGESGGTERIVALDALREGDVVAHRLVPGLVGRIVAIKDGRAALRLLTFPSDHLRRWYRDKPMPVRVENLTLAE